MRVDLFDFDLPKDRIALRPASPRDSARLLVVQPDRMQDRQMRDLADYLGPNDILIFNDTRVIPARLTGRKGEGKVEVTLHQMIDAASWKAFARPAKKLSPGVTITFEAGLTATVRAKGEAGEVTLTFNCAGPDLRAALDKAGVMPLPPYIASQRAPDDQDQHDYQTVFANRDGAVAAPTAGLHFTPAMLDSLSRRQVAQAAVTLHVGAGTFLPVKVDDTSHHKMHAEWGEVSQKTAQAIAEAKARGGRVVAVGTTALRLLETAAAESGMVEPWAGDTDIFITPGYQFRAVDLLITNFHLPRSTLFMLVSAFAGLERMKAAYAHAVADHYRFYSYGDGSLLYRAP